MTTGLEIHSLLTIPGSETSGDLFLNTERSYYDQQDISAAETPSYDILTKGELTTVNPGKLRTKELRISEAGIIYDYPP